jgi:hypothetical protein
MTVNQSGVSGLLGFLTGLDKGKQERRQYQDQTAQMGLQFAKEANETNRQNRAEQQQRDAFQLQKDAAAQAKRAADQQFELNKIALDTQKQTNDPYNRALRDRKPIADLIATAESGLPKLLSAYSTERNPAKQQSILAEINMIRRDVNRRKNEYKDMLSTYGLSPDQIEKLMLFGQEGQQAQQQQGGFNVPGAPTQQGGFTIPGAVAPSGPVQQTGFNIPGAPAVPNIAKPQEQLPMTSFGQQGPQAGNLGAVKPTGLIGGQQAGGAPPSAPIQLPNGNVGIDAGLSTYLSGLGLSIAPGKDHELTPDEYKTMMDGLKGRNLSSLVGPQNLSRPQLNQRGLIDPNAPLPSIDYGKVIQGMYGPIGDAFKATARQMGRNIADVQRGLIGDDPANWPLDADGNPQTPADGGAALKAAMMPFVSVDPKTVQDWTAQQALTVKENYAAIKDEKDKAFEAEENRKNRLNAKAIAELGKAGAIGAAEKTAGAATQGYFTGTLADVDQNYSNEYNRLVGTLASGNPTTLEEIGFTEPKTKQRIPIEVAKAIVDTTTRVMTSEQRNHIITDTSDPLKAINKYKQAKSTSILKARYEGIRAGIKRQREVVQAKKKGQGDNPLPDTDDDVVLLRSLEKDRQELDKIVNGGK